MLVFVGTGWAQTHPDFFQIGQRDINQGVYGIPGRLTQTEEKEQGDAIDALLREQIVLSLESEVTLYLQRLAEVISSRSDFEGPIRVQLGRNQRHLAFATMAGYLYIDEEIFQVAENEAELAGVLAHEIGHLAARHGAENTLRTRLLKEMPGHITALLGPLQSISGPESSSNVEAFWKAVRFSNEIEADELATQYLWNAGFDPEGLLHFLGRIKDESRLEERPVLQAKVSHPPLTIRRERIEKALEMLPPLAEFRVDSSSFAAARDRLRSR
jgi:predicted Zn-dependent protease